MKFAGDPQAVVSALQGQFQDVKLEGQNTIVVTSEPQLVPKAIFDIGNAGVEVQDIDIRKPTLEDVFLQIARGNS